MSSVSLMNSSSLATRTNKPNTIDVADQGATEILTMDLSQIDKAIRGSNKTLITLHIWISLCIGRADEFWKDKSRDSSAKSFFGDTKTFAEYSKARWGYSKSRTQEYLRVGRTLLGMMREVREGSLELPKTMQVGMELAKIPEEQRLANWLAHLEDGTDLPVIETKKSKKNKATLEKTFDDSAGLTSAYNPTLDDLIGFMESLPEDDLITVLTSIVPRHLTPRVLSMIEARPSGTDLLSMTDK